MLKDTFVDEKINKSISLLNKDESEKIAEYLSREYYLPYINLKIQAPEVEALEKIEESFAKKYNIAPFKYSSGYLHLAISDPKDPQTIAELKKIKEENNPPVIIYCASQNSLNHIFEYYKDLKKSKDRKGGVINLDSKYLEKILTEIISIEDYQNIVKKIIEEEKTEKVTKLIEILFAGAIHFKASDLHIEPSDNIVKFRFRIDGNLNDIFFSDKETYALLNTRLKLLSGLKLLINAKDQDGRFSINTDFGDIEMRVSLIPGAFGESYVIRILDPRSAEIDLDILGFNDILKNHIQTALNKPYGLLLTTGPTGSGKSTTLYSFIKKIQKPELKIVTIEDPIEYHMDGVVQTQVNSKEGYTFLSGLRSMLRQDPDVIMIGEIRDSDTAVTAANAAVTGHIVLSTLHANNSVGALSRLSGLGVDIKTIMSSVNLIMAQRLCRKLCPYCKIYVEMEEEKSKLFTNILGEMMIHNKNLNHTPAQNYFSYKANPAGCKECVNGYKGRVAIAEAIIIDERIEDIVEKKTSDREIRELIDYQGIPSLREDAIIKILSGITSLEEVEKVIDIYNK